MNHRDSAVRRRYKPAFAALRVIAITFLATLLGFCIGLFFGIVGVVLTKMIRGTSTPDMAVAYRHVALPIAIAALIATFIVALVTELRHYRRERDAVETRRAA